MTVRSRVDDDPVFDTLSDKPRLSDAQKVVQLQDQVADLEDKLKAQQNLIIVFCAMACATSGPEQVVKQVIESAQVIYIDPEQFKVQLETGMAEANRRAEASGRR